MVIADFGTLNSAGPFHPNFDDTVSTLSFRFLHGVSEPSTAYHSSIMNRQFEGSCLRGIVIEQPPCSFGSWRGKHLLHASSCDLTIPKVGNVISSIALAFSKKLSLLKETEKDNVDMMPLADMESI